MTATGKAVGVRYAVVVNLDYETHPAEQCRLLWDEIESHMVAAGFRCDGRIFTIDLPEAEAAQRARAVIESLEMPHRDFYHKRIYNYLRDFYGFDLACTTNLMLPPADQIEIEES